MVLCFTSIVQLLEENSCWGPDIDLCIYLVEVDGALFIWIRRFCNNVASKVCGRSRYEKRSRSRRSVAQQRFVKEKCVGLMKAFSSYYRGGGCFNEGFSFVRDASFANDRLVIRKGAQNWAIWMMHRTLDQWFANGISWVDRDA